MKNRTKGFLFLFVLLWILAGCRSVHREIPGKDEIAHITISNDWTEEGEDEVVLMEGTEIRLAVPLRKKRATQVYARSSMKRLVLSFTESGRFFEFLAGIRPGHEYAIYCSPCCLFRIEDKDDDPYEFPGGAIFSDSDGRCPQGMIPLFPGLAEDPDGTHRCIPAPRIRFRIAEEVLRKAPVVVTLGKALGNEQIEIRDEETEYLPFDIVESGTPLTVSVVQNGKLLWEGMVIFRVKHSYSLEYDPSQTQPVLIKLDD